MFFAEIAGRAGRQDRLEQRLDKMIVAVEAKAGKDDPALARTLRLVSTVYRGFGTPTRPETTRSEPWRSRQKAGSGRPRFGRDASMLGLATRGSHGMPIASRIAWNVCRFVGRNSAKNIVWLRAFWAISGSSIFGCSVIGKPRRFCAAQ